MRHVPCAAIGQLSARLRDVHEVARWLLALKKLLMGNVLGLIPSHGRVGYMRLTCLDGNTLTLRWQTLEGLAIWLL